MEIAYAFADFCFSNMVAAYLAMTIGVLAQPSDLEKADRQAEEAYYARNYRRATELALHVLESRRREPERILRVS